MFDMELQIEMFMKYTTL